MPPRISQPISRRADSHSADVCALADFKLLIFTLTAPRQRRSAGAAPRKHLKRPFGVAHQFLACDL